MRAIERGVCRIARIADQPERASVRFSTLEPDVRTFRLMALVINEPILKEFSDSAHSSQLGRVQ